VASVSVAVARKTSNGDLRKQMPAPRPILHWVTLGFLAAVVMVLSLALLCISRDDKTARRPEAQPGSPADEWPAPAAMDAATHQPRRPQGEHHPRAPEDRPAPRPRGPETLADLMGADDDSPPDTSTVTSLLYAARRAMVDRELGTARQHVQAALQAARTRTERDEAQRVEKLLVSLEAFWQAVRREAGRLGAGEELPVGDTLVAVVEADQEHVILRAAGSNRTFAITALPGALAVLLAERGLKGRPESNLHVGSFLAADAQGDRAAARGRWEQAGVEGRALLPELDMLAKVRASLQGPAVAPLPAPPATPPTSTATRPPANKPPVAGKPGGPVAGRQPVPDAAAQAKAEQEVREVFSADFSAARNLQGKMALAKKLFEAGKSGGDDAAARYALEKVALDLSVEIGDPEAICSVVDELERHYQIDALAMKAEGISAAWRSAGTIPYRMAQAKCALALAREALEAKNYPAAEQALQVAMAAARASKDFRLLRQLEEAAKEVKAAQRPGGL